MSIKLGKKFGGQKEKTFTTNQETCFLAAATREGAPMKKGPGRMPGAFWERLRAAYLRAAARLALAVAALAVDTFCSTDFSTVS